MVNITALMPSMPSLLPRQKLFSAFFLVFVFLILYTTHFQVSPASILSSSAFKKSKAMARQLSVAELMKRSLTGQLHTMPKLFPQSWLSHNLPAKFEKWSATCRQAHPD